jgi:hypothetical protein
MKGLVKYILFAVLTTVLTTTAFADVKVKIRQTLSGQAHENTTYIKGKRQRTEQNMSGMQMVTLTQCDMKRSVQLNPQTQVYVINSWENDTTAPTTTNVSGNTKTEVKKGGVVTYTITTKDTGETRKMFGFTARHLIITSESEASADACTPQKKTKMVTDGWYIDAAFALDCDYGQGGYSRYNDGGGCRDKYDFKQVGTAKRGYPVIEKTTMYDEAGKETFTMMSEVIELSNTTLDQALFDVPKDWREVKDSTALYASMTEPTTNTSSMSSTSYNSTSQSTTSNNSSMNSTIQSMNTQTTNSAAALEPKKAGTVRIGIAGVKTGAIGEGINATELAGAIQNSLGQYLKGTKVELVAIEAKLASAIESEAKEKECDYVLYATVSHKKGGGGFGMFSKMAPVLGSVVPMAGMGSTAGAVCFEVASTAIYTAGSASANIKPKDELTLDISLKNGATQTLTKQFKAKAKSAGEDIISPIVEQAATAIVETVGK